MALPIGGPIDRTSPVPLYFQIAENIRTAIESGTLRPGERLENEALLSKRFAVSRPTVRQAVQRLAYEGLVVRQRGFGTVVVNHDDRYVRHFGSLEELVALWHSSEAEVVSPLQPKVEVEAASRLRLRSDQVFTAALTRLHAGVPFCYSSIYLPPHIGRLLADARELSLPGRRSRILVIRLIDLRMNGSITAAEQSISAVGAPSFAAGYLARDTGEPVLRIDRLYLDNEGVPVELAVSYFDPEYYSYRLMVRWSPARSAALT